MGLVKVVYLGSYLKKQEEGRGRARATRKKKKQNERVITKVSAIGTKGLILLNLLRSIQNWP